MEDRFAWHCGAPAAASTSPPSKRQGLGLTGILALVLLGSTGCAPSPAMLAAARGDRDALHADIARRENLGDLPSSEAAALAKVVAEHELATTSSADAVERVRDLSSCAHELDDALADRMRTHDVAGAEAALARVESHRLDAQDLRAYVSDGEEHWRAVGARGLVRPEDRDARVRAMVDPSPVVRREAVRAARDGADPGDFSALAESARVDPEPIVRTEAVRAIAALTLAGPSNDWRRAAVDLLRDLWTMADDGLREDIALAWSGDGMWWQGGRDALRTVVATSVGPPAIEAAAAVLRRRDADTDVAALASGQLASAIRSGPRVTRLQALAQAPFDRPGLAEAVRKAATDDDRLVRIAALARLVGEHDPRAVVDLETLGSPGSPVADRARLASAMAGDRRVQSWIEERLASGGDDDRLAAAVALAALGVEARAAPLLADPIARVRARASCVILMAARRSGS
jgi:hypothetical protein